MSKKLENKQNNGKLSLRPLKFEEAIKDLLKVKPIKKSTISENYAENQQRQS